MKDVRHSESISVYLHQAVTIEMTDNDWLALKLRLLTYSQ